MTAKMPVVRPVAAKHGHVTEEGSFYNKCGVLDHLEDIGVGGKIVLQNIFKKYEWGVDWTDLSQERDEWRAIVKEAMKQFP
jgi:hypothetical protein